MWYLSVCGSRGGEPRCTCLRSRRGIVNWPDGWPLTNAQIQFYPQGTDLTPITETTGPDGSKVSRLRTNHMQQSPGMVLGGQL